MTDAPINVPFWLEAQPVLFPPSHLALTEPDGLLAVGGDLTPEWLMQAYSKGIFPWFNPGEPILWWTPNPRSVLFIDALRIKKSLRKTIQKIEGSGALRVTLDQNFSGVMQACAKTPRHNQDGTWISDKMLTAYQSLHQAGHAHSVEVWQDDRLVGGLYGVSVGKMFFGESMFSHVTDSSKIALVALAMQLKAWGFEAIDTQVETAHLKSLGATAILRTQFEELIHQQTQLTFAPHTWQLSIDWFAAIKTHLESQKTNI